MTLEERLRRLEDDAEIQRRLSAYGHAIDYGFEEMWADCWTDDAVLSWPDRNPICGRSAIVAAFRRHTHAPEVFHKHFVLEPLISIQGDEARVDSMFARIDAFDGRPAIRAFGRYRDILQRCRGTWRFAQRTAQTEARRT